MALKPIRNDEDYHAALQEIEQLWDAEPGTPESDTLDILVTLVEAYERDRYDLPSPDPIAALEYFMESRGWTRKQLEPYLGSRGRVSEILGRKRPLTLPMIRRLESIMREEIVANEEYPDLVSVRSVCVRDSSAVYVTFRRHP